MRDVWPRRLTPELGRALLRSVRQLHEVPPPAGYLEEEFRAELPRLSAIADAIDPLLDDWGRPRLLEAGLGYGAVSTYLRFRFGSAIALYATEHPARRSVATPEFREFLAEHDVEFATADLRDGLPWPGTDFDGILFTDVIEHLEPTVVPDVLRLLGSRLAFGGRLVVTSSNLQSLHRRLSIAIGRGAVFDLPAPLEYAGGTYPHLRLYGRADMEALIAHVGLELLDWRWVNWEYVFIPADSARHRFLRALQKHGPRLAPSMSSSWQLIARRLIEAVR